MASSSGPKLETVARSCAPLSPVRLRYSTGEPAGCQANPVSRARWAMRSFDSPATPMPERSPLRSARNTGTPAVENCSAISCSVLVLPVPVAPAIRPWRVAMASGSVAMGCGSQAPSWTIPPSTTVLAAGNAAFAASMTFESMVPPRVRHANGDRPTWHRATPCPAATPVAGWCSVRPAVVPDPPSTFEDLSLLAIVRKPNRVLPAADAKRRTRVLSEPDGTIEP